MHMGHQQKTEYYMQDTVGNKKKLLIREKIVTKLDAAEVFSKVQHGFRHGRPCFTNLLETFENWTEALDKGYGLDILYLDFRKAFDTVPHKRLILKLQQYGISGSLLKWIEDFFDISEI